MTPTVVPLFDLGQLPKTEPGPGFDEFWELQVRKRSKEDAGKAWDAALKAGTPAQTIIEGWERALPEMQERERQFVPYPASWIRGKCWTDEPDVDDTGKTGAEIMAEIEAEHEQDEAHD